MTAARKTALVTGGTDGIGKEVARLLIRAGYHVGITGRDAEKARHVSAELSGVAPDAQVDVFLADFLRPAAVRQLGKEVQERFSRLDVLVNNAGAYFAKRELTPDGFERTFALNHLSAFVLTQALLPLLRKSAPSRIINVSSDAHRTFSLDFEDLQYERRPWAGGWGAYGGSKLANILFTRELARRLEGTGVTANAVHPGFVASRFGHNNPGFASMVLLGLQRVFARTPLKGAETIAHLATSPAVADVSGRYFYDLRERKPSGPARDDETAAQLWTVSERLLASLV